MGRPGQPTTLLLICGVLAPLVYIGTDLLAALLYPGYSYTSQAPSELFAIGAPTSHLVVPLFSLFSVLLVAFACGVWLSADGSRVLHVLAVMIAANGIDSLLLWNFFPMHMRGVERTFTDKMHLVLAVNPFVLVSIVLGAVSFRSWFRLYSIGTIVILVVLATMAFLYVPQVVAQESTPWLGLSERLSQYAIKSGTSCWRPYCCGAEDIERVLGSADPPLSAQTRPAVFGPAARDRIRL